MADTIFTALLIGIAVHFLAGYLFGSIPFGLIFTRMAGLGDIRAIGSKNIGATNVLRTGRKDIAFATLLADMLKGTFAVLLAAYIAGDPHTSVLEKNLGELITGFGAFIGHVFPVWLRFRGGKGVATYIGVLLGFFWPAALAFGAIWLFTAFVSRYSSLSALVAAVLTPVVLYFMTNVQAAGFFAIMSLILIIKHHANISRLLAGTETKIGKSAAPVGG
ncbi:glycerol-3-phosphate acyltransferase [Terrihabitans soli]|uniref:Glycerol-3-phosphate acyltransferase n=1 Tax=Terrihabitans soli TaxID=708113 RepID=A0A6S6QV32_9HYPH|nr:glycerol-3-phosphate 1-O-acyltransferase PlsY [Terrihabitans soli]BCJ91122.1 glycerol-3-phosphate acyltransferase [Terrihabitans soli]